MFCLDCCGGGNAVHGYEMVAFCSADSGIKRHPPFCFVPSCTVFRAYGMAG